jgi:hypothetical protein
VRTKHLSYYVTPRNLIFGNYVDEVMFGVYPGADERSSTSEGPPLAEMGMRWYDLGSSHDGSARLEIYDSSWAALAEMPDLLMLLGSLSRHETTASGRQKKAPVTVKEFTDGLDALGFERRDVMA